MRDTRAAAPAQDRLTLSRGGSPSGSEATVAQSRQAQEQANSGNVSGAIATLRQGVSRYPDDAWMRLIGVSAGVAIFASVIGNAFWNQASRLLPLTMLGQMMSINTHA